MGKKRICVRVCVCVNEHQHEPSTYESVRMVYSCSICVQWIESINEEHCIVSSIYHFPMGRSTTTTTATNERGCTTRMKNTHSQNENKHEKIQYFEKSTYSTVHAQAQAHTLYLFRSLQLTVHFGSCECMLWIPFFLSTHRPHTQSYCSMWAHRKGQELRIHRQFNQQNSFHNRYYRH